MEPEIPWYDWVGVISLMVLPLVAGVLGLVLVYKIVAAIASYLFV